MNKLAFHPLIRDWFVTRFAAPTAPQAAGWKHIASGRDTLIAAPTGSGKTLAAFLWTINRLVDRGAGASGLPLLNETSVIYVSPLKALGNDIQKNLQQPLSEIQKLASSTGTMLPDIRVTVRSGDTPSSERQAMLRKPPHILITTPESLYILLTAERSRRMLQRADTVIVDEIHAVAGDKRGAHLALSLERLDDLAGHRLQRIGLSATQKPIEEIARLLVGSERILEDGRPDCAIVDVGHKRDLDLRIEIPDFELGPIATHELYAAIYDRIVALTREHRTVIVFVNTRRLVERIAHQLGERLGKDKVAAHHGSLSRPLRLRAEEGLKGGTIPVVVATASLELGIDVGYVDLVCHVGSTRSLATLLQRVGRSGHWSGAVPKGIFFPLTRDDLVQCAAAVRAVRQGELDRILLVHNPLDILAQQIVATVAGQEMAIEAVWNLVRRAYPFRTLERSDFDAVLSMLCDGVTTKRGRRSAHLHRDEVHGILRPRRGARLAAITGGGAIPDTADYDVIEDPTSTFVGKVNEDFAVESMAGDIFLLGNRSWRIRRGEMGKMRVEDAHGAPPSIPFWMGEAPARTQELSAAVADLRAEVAARRHDVGAAHAWLTASCGVDAAGADQLVAYIDAAIAALGAVPTQQTVIAERFFDEGGGMQLVVHAPFGGRINRAWGLALRKRFCRSFDFELQAAATDDGIVLSLGEQHSFPLESVFEMVRLSTLEEDLTQAALAAPMFGTRWRWNATRALTLLRHMGGKRVPMPIQRMRAEDLLAAVFPAQVGCQDNRPGGPIELPDHPLVNETADNCLHEAMDLDGLRGLLEAIKNGTIRALTVDTPSPSPLSHEILNANPYAFLDDAPLEERRARAVSLRRIDPDLATGIGALDAAAIEEVRRQAWPDVRDADELHDLLLTVGLLPAALTLSVSIAQFPVPGFLFPVFHSDFSTLPLGEGRGEGWSGYADTLIQRQRAVRAHWGDTAALLARERMALVHSAVADAVFEPALAPLPNAVPVEPEEAVRSIVRGWMEILGPVTVAQLATFLSLGETAVEIAMLGLENEGVVLRGQFTTPNPQQLAPQNPRTPEPQPPQTRPPEPQHSVPPEWCERRLLARIHRLTLGRLRREIEAVSAADFVRFLLRWQHLSPGTKLHKRDGVAQIIAQLQGIEIPAPAWERDVLAARIHLYDPSHLEQLCLAGEVAWGRLRLPTAAADDEAAPLRRHRKLAPTRSAPLAFVTREALPWLLRDSAADTDLRADLSAPARRVHAQLTRFGASFLADLARAAGLLPTQTEDALWELVARGLVTGDGIAGLRTLLLPEEKRRERPRHLRDMRGGAARRRMPVGRWSLLRPHLAASDAEAPSSTEHWAQQLLQRYGIVLRELLAREACAPPWRSLLAVYRRMEARGEVRGGRFIDGFVGEQFALPEAVDALRAGRRAAADAEAVIVAAADPLNLVGILTPGARVSPFSNQVIAYRDGVPVEIGELGTVISRVQQAPATAADLQR